MTSREKKRTALEALARLQAGIRAAEPSGLCTAVRDLRLESSHNDPAQSLVASMALALETALRCR